MDKVDIGYLAGIIDGEGSLGIEKTIKNTYQGYTLEPALRIVNTNKELLEHCKKLIGCGHIYGPWQINERWKPEYVLVVRKMRCLLKVLETVEDFLIVKKKQCKLVKEFITLRIKHLGGGNLMRRPIIRDPKNGQILRVLPVLYTKRELQIFEELKCLNRRSRPITVGGIQ